MAETAIVVPVLEAEPLVGEFRRRHTPSGADGMPAHVTLLVPFTDSDQLTERRTAEVTRILSRFPPVDAVFARCAYFAEGPVLYLEPEPARPFDEMIAALAGAFPEHPPYEGAHPDPVPHLTVAVGLPSDKLERIAGTVEDGLPLEARLTEAWLVEHRPEGWRPRRRFLLAGSTSVGGEPTVR